MNAKSFLFLIALISSLGFMKLPQFFRVAALLAMFALSTHAQSWLTNGLVAYYPFNGNANDASGYGNNGTPQGAVLVADRFGKANQAYKFNGTNSFISFSSVPLSQKANWSITAWLKPASLYQTGWAVLVGYDDGNAGSGFGFDDPNGNGYGFGITGTSGGSAGSQLYMFFGGVVYVPSGYSFPTNNQWYHVVMVNSAGTTALYVNAAPAPFTHVDIPKVPTSFIIGSSDGLRFFNGAIDDVRLYNRALSSNEVAQLYAFESTLSPYTAIGTAILTGSIVTGVSITYGGYGYTNTPLVRLIGGGGSEAQAFAVISNGVVKGITITNAGYGYTNAPQVVIEPPYILNPVFGIAPMSLLSFSNLTIGGSYQMQQKWAWYWTNQPTSFTASSAIYTQMVEGVRGSGDFRLALNPVPAQAFATGQMVNGFVVGATVTAGGAGYVTAPAVTIYGRGGSNATAISKISGGVVTNINITDAGIGYTNTAIIEIAPPPAAAVFPTVQPSMRVDSAGLAPYDNYQIQFTPVIGGTWGNWDGGLFTPVAVTNSKFLFITNGIGFFRLQYEP